MIFDVRTMGFFSAITPLVLGLIMLIYLRERKVYEGFGLWVLANFGLSVGNFLSAVRGTIPDFPAIVLSNVIILYCVILVYEGNRRFYGRPTFSPLNYVILGVYIPLQIYFTHFQPDINRRVVFSSIALGILTFRAGFALYRETIPGFAKTSRSASYVMMFTGLFPFARAIIALARHEPIDFFSDAMNSWLSIIVIVSIVVWTFYFFFLNSARLELDLETARARLDQIARTDPLTNLYNRRHFNEHAEIEFQRARRLGRNLSFLVLDADEFKHINDRHGHDAGDAMLRSISMTLQAELRSFDLIARFGGDEFLIMLTDADREDACAIAERLRNAVRRNEVAYNSGSLNIQLSVGVATLDPDDSDVETVLRRADRALYDAKSLGRNRVMFSNRTN